ncbi:Cytochrome c553 [Amphritea atlantica]|uniref:Cytochrome c553 n=1 Tax=Amphritea atlantica TaxID=355243 RepID=A0A1H9LYM5_9GAMM|nr:Cytochrome c553 [Amphritea atlantica]
MIATRPIILSIICILFLNGCSDSTPQTDSTDGEKLYGLYCETCHKSDGSGKFLKGIPANRYTSLQKDQVIMLIRQGDPSRPDMPAFTNLTEEQASAIVEYLFSLRIY